MDFELTAEQQAWQEQFRQLAGGAAQQLDENERVGTFPRETWNELAEKGWLGLPVPIDYGGREADFLSFVVAIEELSAASPSLGLAFAVHIGMTALVLCRFANEDQKVRWVTPLTTGEALGAFAGAGPEDGADAGTITLAAESGEGGYVLNGTRNFIANGSSADQLLVFAATAPGAGNKGISAFLVDGSSEGLTRGAPLEKLGLRAVEHADLKFENCAVDADRLIGSAGEGWSMLLWAQDRARVAAAAQELGVARSALEQVVEFARDGRKFGKSLSEAPSVQELVAETATRLRAARFLTWQAASLCDAGKNFAREAAMARRFCAQTANLAVDGASRILGADGCRASHPVERLYRDARVLALHQETGPAENLLISRRIFQEGL